MLGMIRFNVLPVSPCLLVGSQDTARIYLATSQIYPARPCARCLTIKPAGFFMYTDACRPNAKPKTSALKSKSTIVCNDLPIPQDALYPPFESPRASPPPPEVFEVYEDSDLDNSVHGSEKVAVVASHGAVSAADLENSVHGVEKVATAASHGAVSAESGSLRRSREDFDIKGCLQAGSLDASPTSAGAEGRCTVGDMAQV
jgi:hypothetical protein